MSKTQTCYDKVKLLAYIHDATLALLRNHVSGHVMKLSRIFTLFWSLPTPDLVCLLFGVEQAVKCSFIRAFSQKTAVCNW